MCRKCKRYLKKPRGMTWKERTCQKCRTKDEQSRHFDRNSKKDLSHLDEPFVSYKALYLLPHEIIVRQMTHNLAEKWRNDCT